MPADFPAREPHPSARPIDSRGKTTEPDTKSDSGTRKRPEKIASMKRVITSSPSAIPADDMFKNLSTGTVITDQICSPFAATLLQAPHQQGHFIP